MEREHLSEVNVVRSWHRALNEGDLEGLIGLSHPDVEVGGPRGVGRGVQLLREWVNRANICLDPRRIFHRAGTVVVEQEAQWRSPDTGELAGRQTVACVFTIRDGRITRLTRYSELADALREGSLDYSHEVPLT